MLTVMEQDTGANGMKKCRKFTGLVGFYKTMSVISTTLPGLYCALRQHPTENSADTAPSGAFGGGMPRKYSKWGWVAIISLLAWTPAHASSRDTTRQAKSGPHAAWHSQTGTASYYGPAHQGKRTASGRRFDQKEFTAAHASLPFGTRLRVTAQGSGRSVVVVVTDRLHSNTRVVDLSLAAARQLGMVRQGLARVSLTPA